MLVYGHRRQFQSQMVEYLRSSDTTIRNCQSLTTIRNCQSLTTISKN